MIINPALVLLLDFTCVALLYYNNSIQQTHPFSHLLTGRVFSPAMGWDGDFSIKGKVRGWVHFNGKFP